MKREKSGIPLPHTRSVVAWNQGRLIGPKPPLKPKQIWAIHLHLQREERIRDLAMFDLAIDSKPRGCDLVRLKICQLVVNTAVRHCATVVQQKTGQPVQFGLTEGTRDSLLAWLTQRGRLLDLYVFPSRAGRASTSALASMLAWSASGSKPLVSPGQHTALTACAERRSRLPTSGQATCGQCRSSLAIRSLRARCGISALMPRMH